MPIKENYYKNLVELKQDSHFIESIINAMYDWVRVLDREGNVIFLNKAMSEGLNANPIGEKCYTIIGRSSPCENCISQKAIVYNEPYEKEETIAGKTFSIMSSPIKDLNGDVLAVVEVLRDISQMKQLQQRIIKQNKRLQNDLGIAKKLQCSLLPKGIPMDKIDFSFIYKPCEALGGDFLDIYKIDEDHVGIYIADVSGHGVSASMLTVFLRSSINRKVLSPAQALKDLYKEFNHNGFDRDLYITVFYAILDLSTNQITYSNAGHNVSPVLFGSDRFELLRVAGVPISDWVEEPNYLDKVIDIKKGDRLFLYTDGIVEKRNSNNEQFGEERLLEALLNDTSHTAATLNHIIGKVYDFAGTTDCTGVCDDITIALVAIK